MTKTATTDVQSKQSPSAFERLERLLLAIFPFLLWLPKVTPKNIKIDAVAGVTSAIFALPQGLAFALIAGLPPEFGLYAAMIAPVVTADFNRYYEYCQ